MSNDINMQEKDLKELIARLEVIQRLAITHNDVILNASIQKALDQSYDLLEHI